jgi:hypothetical protein
MDPICEPDELSVEFSLRAEQARHNVALASPWAGVECSYQTSDCLRCVDAGEISFLAFCGPDLAPGDVTVTPTAVNLAGETVGYRWHSTATVDRVVLKLGNGYDVDGTGSGPPFGGPDPTNGEFAMYEFDAGGTSGTVLSGQGTLVLDGQPWAACPDAGGLKYDVGTDEWSVVIPDGN